MKPLISVIIPVYQVEKYIEECIRSVISQTNDNWEIILVNDGSQDNSGNICDLYSEKDKRIQTIHKVNGGLSDARNKGLEKAIGEYIIFLDSDDYWIDKEFLEKVNRCIKENINTEMILFEAKRIIEETGEFVLDNKLDVNFINNNNKNEIVKKLIQSKTYSMSACTKVINRKFLLENNIEFQKGLLGEDLDWFLNILVNVKNIKAVESINYVYRVRQGSITKTISLKSIEDQFWMLDKWVPIIENNETLKRYKRYYMGILSYSYVIDILVFSQLKNKDKKKVEHIMEKYSYLLNYDVNKIISITKFTYKLLGLKITSFLLNKYYFLKG